MRFVADNTELIQSDEPFRGVQQSLQKHNTDYNNETDTH